MSRTEKRVEKKKKTFWLWIILSFLLGAMITSCQADGTALECGEPKTVKAAEVEDIDNNSEQEVKKQEVKKQEVKKQEVKKQEVKKQEVKKQEVKKQEVKKQEVKKQEVKKQEVKKQEVKKQEVKKQEVKKQEVKKLIKGNISSSGEKIYHVPGGAYYDRTEAEEMFATEEEAEKAGFRKSKR